MGEVENGESLRKRDRLISSQRACGGQALTVNGLSWKPVERNLFGNLFGRAGVGRIRKSDDFFTIRGETSGRGELRL